MTDTVRSPIEVVPYDPAWPRTFDRIRADQLDALLGVPIVGIEHVGSTAVEGRQAKPIIDVDIVVERDGVEPAIRALERGGYVHRGELGIVDRHSMAEPDPPPRNVYVVVAGSLALRNHLAVREALRADPALRDAYGRLKLALTEEVGDIGDYVHRKSELLAGILAGAGLDAAEVAAIRAANEPPR